MKKAKLNYLDSKLKIKNRWFRNFKLKWIIIVKNFNFINKKVINKLRIDIMLLIKYGSN